MNDIQKIIEFAQSMDAKDNEELIEEYKKRLKELKVAKKRYNALVKNYGYEKMFDNFDKLSEREQNEVLMIDDKIRKEVRLEDIEEEAFIIEKLLLDRNLLDIVEALNGDINE